MGFIIFIVLAGLVATAIFVGITAAYCVITVFLVFCAFKARKNYQNSLLIQPSVKKCPACGSVNISIGFVSSNATTSTFSLGKNSVQSTTRVNQLKTAVCQECGKSWGFMSPDDVVAYQSSMRGNQRLFTALAIFFVVAGALVYIWLK
ncbi:MAG: hypothetical protein Q4F83_04950 [Eubacteriales bacterium]|nr:hypothetical protein [Eubacteriales bacterium]